MTHAIGVLICTLCHQHVHRFLRSSCPTIFCQRLISQDRQKASLLNVPTALCLALSRIACTSSAFSSKIFSSLSAKSSTVVAWYPVALPSNGTAISSNGPADAWERVRSPAA